MPDFTFPTFRAITDYKARQSVILINTFERLLEHPQASMFIDTFGEDGLYDQLVYHQKQILGMSEISSSELLNNYLVWRMHVLSGKGVSNDYLILEANIWSESILHSLFEAYGHEFLILYRQIINSHKQIQDLAENSKKIFLEKSITDLVHYLINADEDGSRKIIEKSLNDFANPTKTIDRIIKPAMDEVGRLWELGEISVAKEHLATAIIEKIAEPLHDQPPLIQNPKRALIIVPEEQLHRLGASLLEKLLRNHGWSAIHITLEENFNTVLDALIELDPDLVVISTMLPIHIPLIQRFIDYLRNDFKNFTGKIAVGGAAFYSVEPPFMIRNCDFQGNSLSELEEFLERL